MSRSRGKWEYRGHWINNNVRGSDTFYAHWYEGAHAKRKGRPCRKSLKTGDLEEAKDKLVAFVLRKQTHDEDALILSVLAKYHAEVAPKLRSREQARRTMELFKEVLEGPERISDLSERFQVDYILKVWRARHGHAAGYLARNMNMLSAAVRYCGAQPTPRIIHDPRTIAKLLRIPPPVAGKWFPRDDDDLARFIDNLGSEMAFRWTVIALNTACRPEAGLDLGPSQIDHKLGLIDLNPEGRPQQPTKFRPVIRLTENLAGWVRSWDKRLQMVRDKKEFEEFKETAPWKLLPRFVPYRSTHSLQREYKRVRQKKAVCLPKIVPYSVRNKMITVMRMAQVPGSQRSLWLGHADQEESRTTSRSYGEFDPVYLKDAADATDAYLWELNKRTDRDLFAKLHGKLTAKRALLPNEQNTGEDKTSVISVGKVVPIVRFELTTSPLPRECSTPELYGR